MLLSPCVPKSSVPCRGGIPGLLPPAPVLLQLHSTAPGLIRRVPRAACPFGQHTRRYGLHSTSPSTGIQCEPSGGSSPDVIIALPDAAAVHLFGVQHCERQPHIAEHILRTRPAAVVVETALNAIHGAETGMVLRLDDPGMLQQLQSDFYARMFHQLGCQLRDEKEPWTTSSWQTIVQQFGGEQLAYIAAFATGAALVFGDRPKEATFLRLWGLPSLRDLDAAFGQQSALNYREQLTGRPATSDWSATPGEAEHAVERIMLRERDQVLAHSLRDAALAAGPSGTVIGVIGEAHLAGVRHLMQAGHWLSPEELLEMSTPPPAAAVSGDDGSVGVRRALLEAAMRLRTRPEVCAALDATLPPVPPDQLQQYHLTTELYGTCRMMLAPLNEPQLAEVASGWRCNFYDVLEPVRGVRPANGGAGYDDGELIQNLRLLHFQVQDEES